MFIPFVSHCHAFLLFEILLFLSSQEGSDHEEGEDADAEEDEYDLAGDEMSGEDSDSEELEEKGKCDQPAKPEMGGGF